jgi:hypothetical protein
METSKKIKKMHRKKQIENTFKLNDDVLTIIFDKRKPTTNNLMALSLVNKQWNKLCQRQATWKHPFFNRFLFSPENRQYKSAYEKQIGLIKQIRKKTHKGDGLTIVYQHEYLMNALVKKNIPLIIAALDAGCKLIIHSITSFNMQLFELSKLELPCSILACVLDRGIEDRSIIGLAHAFFLKLILKALGSSAKPFFLKQDKEGKRPLLATVLNHQSLDGIKSVLDIICKNNDAKEKKYLHSSTVKNPLKTNDKLTRGDIGKLCKEFGLECNDVRPTNAIGCIIM